jgi:hypothetical protein
MRGLVVAALVLLPVACGSSVDAADDPFPTVATITDATGTIVPALREDDDAVLVVGDSLTHGASLFGELDDRLERAGFDDVEVVAEDGRDVLWAIEEVEALDEVPSLVVLELGTNPGPSTAGFADDVDELVATLRSRGAVRIAWLTPVHGRDDRYDDKVAILEGTEGIDVVADWASIAQDDPRRLAADGLHPTEDGYADLARFLVVTAVELADS